MKSIRNIGILAHVDAGKTSITENFLFLGGTIRQKGSVDNGSAVTDSLAIEKERGISVRSAANSFDLDGHRVNLIDTPGHTDFYGEVDRVMEVLDGAVLVLSAVEGLQSSVYVLWELLQHYKIPTLIFINKVDRAGSDYEQVLEDIENELDIKHFPLKLPDGEGSHTCTLKDAKKHNAIREKGLEFLAGLDEEFLEKYLDGKSIADEEIEELIIKYTGSADIFPVFCGSAKFEFGLKELLDGVIKFLPIASQNVNGEVSGRIFKIEHDASLGRIAHVRMLSGQLKNRYTVYNQRLKKDEKIAQIRRNLAHKQNDTGEINAGDIGILSGLSEAWPGDIIGNLKLPDDKRSFQIPVLLVKVKAARKEDYQKLADALRELNAEDPLLDFQWFKKEQEFQLKLMGNIQKEILAGILKLRFSLDAKFEAPTVIYKETPIQTATGYVEYTMPKPCWAVMRFKVEPLPSGSGLQYESKVSVDKIARKYQNEVSNAIPKALAQGIKGWEVVDLKVTMIDGEDHEIHSRPGDFILATPMGLLRALKEAGTNLLEPVYDFVLVFPEEYLGSITSDLTKMRGTFDTPEFKGGMIKLSGRVPVATSLDYSIRLNSITSGRGQVRFRFGAYQSCTDEQGKTRTYKGVNPLDESLWILHHRGAYKADER